MIEFRTSLGSLAVALACALGPAAAQTEPVSRPTLLLRVRVGDPAADIARLAMYGLDIAGVDPKAGTVDVVGDTSTQTLLKTLGYAATVAKDLTATPESIEALTDYLEPSEINQKIDTLVATYPTLAKKIQYATTGEGRPVYALEISDNVAVHEDEPAIFFVAQHHAREVMTPEIALDIGDWLLSRYATDPQAAGWVDGTEIFILPNHNPDGTFLVFHGDSNWRKNRRVNGDGSFGVDPNRNYPFRWGACAGSSGVGSDETYRGPSPASEPETFQGILELARAKRPVISMSYHTYSELVLMPYGCSGSYTPENQTFRRVASELSSKLVTDDGQFHYQAGTGPEILYAVDGEMDDWFYGELGTYALTIEANSSAQGFQPDYQTWRNSTVQRNRPGWQYLLDRLTHGPSVRGHVRDVCTGAPLQATISLDQVVFSSGETPRVSDSATGRYQWLTTAGASVTVRAAKTGYTTQAWPVTVDTQPVDREIALVPAGSDALGLASVVVGDGGGDGDGQADPGEQVTLTLRLSNLGASTVSAIQGTLTTTDPYVTIVDPSSSYGSLAAGASADGDGFVVQIAPGAPDQHEAVLHLDLTAAVPLCGATQDATLRITIGSPSCPFAGDTLDVNPGWTIQNAGTGGWAFGPPAGNGGSSGPASAFSGANVYGTNLSGNYGDNGNFLLTTGPYDLRGLRNAQLRYMRWLDNEAGYDIASAEMSLDGGVNWVPVWSGFAWGESWQQERLDIPSADQESDVRFRFRLTSDTGVTKPGFYLDDLQLCGEAIANSGGKLKYESSTVSDPSPQGGNGDGAVDAGETVRLAVTLRSNRTSTATGVEAFLSTSTPGVTIRDGYAAFPDAPAGGATASLAPGFSLTAGAACGQSIALTLDIRWDGGSATSAFTLLVGSPTTTTILNDGFETDLGWTTGSAGATAGFFVRDDPNGVTDPLGVPVQPENDTSAAPGVKCWITANPNVGGNFNPLSGDVDKGTVWVQSPMFDGTSAESLPLSYQRWFVRRNAGSFDSSQGRMRVSRDNGTSWVTMRTYTADTPLWSAESLDLVSFVAPSSQMRLRFEVQEQITGPGDTLLEGLIDDVRVDRTRPECDPFNPPLLSPPNGVGASVAASKLDPHLKLTWAAPPTGAGHDAATLYRVYRSPSPSGGFAIAKTPTSPVAVFADELNLPGSAYLLVVAENNGGTSGDIPAP